MPKTETTKPKTDDIKEALYLLRQAGRENNFPSWEDYYQRAMEEVYAIEGIK